MYTRMKNLCVVFSTFFNKYEMSTHLTSGKNPDIRKIYIHGWKLIWMFHLRHGVANISKICVLLWHWTRHAIGFYPQMLAFLLRDKFYANISSHSPDLKDKNEMIQLKYILDLQCPPGTVSFCCQYIWDILCFRGKCDKKCHKCRNVILN